MNVPLINGLRALAILGVVWHHVFGPQFVPGAHPIAIGSWVLPANPLGSNGWLGVNLFFFLSGFVLFLPYATGQRAFASQQNIHDFWEHRARRLLPLFYLSLIVGVAMTRADALVTMKGMGRLMAALSGLFTFFPWTFNPIGNWVLWSLGVELLFSAAFPQIARYAAKRGIWRTLALSVLVSLAVRLTGQEMFNEERDYHNFVSDNIFGRLDDFAWGMACAHLYATRRLPRMWAIVPAGAALLLASAVLSDAWYVHELPLWTQVLTYSVFNCGVFLVTCGLLARRGPLARLLETRPLQLIGMMCFSIYVWHGVLLLRVFPDGTTVQPLGNLVAYLPVYFALLLAIAALTYRFVEFPNRDVRELFLLPRRREVSQRGVHSQEPASAEAQIRAVR